MKKPKLSKIENKSPEKRLKSTKGQNLKSSENLNDLSKLPNFRDFEGRLHKLDFSSNSQI